MKKFRFKLQKLLDIRLKKEEMAKEHFAHALQKYEREKASLLQAKDTLDAEKQLQKERRIGVPLSAMLEQQFQTYFKRLLNDITRHNLQVNLAQNVVDKKRDELIAAQKDRKIIEELKEKQYTEYQLMADKEENKVIDEIATMGAARENEFVMKGF